jgi:hypothetical protein
MQNDVITAPPVMHGGKDGDLGPPVSASIDPIPDEVHR